MRKSLNGEYADEAPNVLGDNGVCWHGIAQDESRAPVHTNGAASCPFSGN